MTANVFVDMFAELGKKQSHHTLEGNVIGKAVKKSTVVATSC